MKKEFIIDNYLKIYNSSQSNKELLDRFFNNVNNSIRKYHPDKQNLTNDFKLAIVSLSNSSLKLDEILKRIDPVNIGIFYKDPINKYYSLDDIAKLYPLFMGKDTMGLFKLSFYLNEDIDKDILQLALDFTIKRFPYFAVSFKRGLFWHFLESNGKRCEVLEDLPTPLINFSIDKYDSQTFKVYYYKNRISLVMFHGVTDASGAKEFLKSLTLTYLNIKGYNVKDNDVIDINSEINVKESENSFDGLKMNSKNNVFHNKKSLQLNSKMSLLKPCQVIHFKINTNDLLNVSKKYGVTLTSYIMSLMFNSFKDYLNKDEGEVAICIPVNLRKYYETETLRNFSLISFIRFDLNEINDIIFNKVDEQIKFKTSKEYMYDMMSSSVRKTQLLNFIPLFIKAPLVKIFANSRGDLTTVSSLSNLGEIKLSSEFKKYIISADFTLSSSEINRSLFSIVSVNNITTISVSKMTKENAFIDKFYDLLVKENLSVEVEGSELYEN